MKPEQFSDALGQVGETYLTQAIAYTPSRRHHPVRWLLPMAACVALLIVAFWPSQTGGKEQGTPEGEATVPSPTPDTVAYGELMRYEGTFDVSLPPQRGEEPLDIAPFFEPTASNCCGILEGTVVAVRAKEYSYDVYSDKWQTGGVLHRQQTTVVYELQVEKVWYGTGFEEKIVTVEDVYFPTAGMCFMKVGGRYVVPLCEEGETIPLWDAEPLAAGNITRESPYATYYPYQPQIEVTRDGQYILSTDWETLTAQNARVILGGEEWPEPEKMRLVDGVTFEVQMKRLVQDRM